MIGTRSFVTAALAVAGLAVGLGPGGPRPEVAIGADALVADRSAALRDDLAALEDQLAPVVDAARAGAARVVSGDEDPAPDLARAGDLLAATVGAAVAVRVDTRALDAALRARDPASATMPAGPDPGEIGSIAAQLGGTAAAGTAFADTRRQAADVTRALDEALGALDDGDLEAAAIATARARSDHRAVAAAGIGAVTLPVWLSTTDAMIGAVERIVAATRRGDGTAAQRAADDFAALSDEAVSADRALRIAIAEGGSAVTAAPIERMAAVLDAIATLRAAIPGPGDGSGR
jgi:hypothetical protein